MNENLRKYLTEECRVLRSHCPAALNNFTAWHFLDDLKKHMEEDNGYNWLELFSDMAIDTANYAGDDSDKIDFVRDNPYWVNKVLEFEQGIDCKSIEDIVDIGILAWREAAEAELTTNAGRIAMVTALSHLIDIDFDCSDLTDEEIDTLRKYIVYAEPSLPPDDAIRFTLEIAEDWYNGRLWETF